jgi:hypothetical protein
VSLSFRDELSNFSDRLAFSMEITVPSKKTGHRVVDYVLARLAFTVTAFKSADPVGGLQSDPEGFMPLSIAEFNL